MTRPTSSCEVPGGARRAPAQPVIARFDAARFRWRGVDSLPYKRQGDGSLAWRGVERFVLVGGAGEPVAFQLRYFEIAPGGYSSLEQHRHAHAVLVVRGRGRIRIGNEVHQVRPMDFVFIPPEAPHQFHAGRGRFGFLCPVDAVRDRPRAVAGRAVRRLPARRRAGTIRRSSRSHRRRTA